MDAVHSVAGEQLNVVLGEPEAVGCKKIGPENSYGVQILDGGEPAVGRLAIFDFLARLGEMYVQGKVVLACEVGRPYHHRLANRVYGVEGELVDGSLVQPLVLYFLVLAFALLHLALGLLRVTVVDYVVAHGRAYSHFGCGLLAGLEEPVLVVEGSSAGAYHLYAGDLGAPVNVVVVEAGFDLPDLLDPVLEHHIFSDAAHQSHSGVGMHIDESGNRHLAGAIHHFDVPGQIPIYARTC